MQKNGLLTLLFACVPGAGQMYQGYMKRGLSLITAFALPLWATQYISGAVMVSLIVYMYSFFDTFNLRAQLMAGQIPEDDYLYHLGEDAKLRKVFANGGYKLLGWGLVLVGVSSLYRQIMGQLSQWLWNMNLGWLYEILYDVPRLLVYVVLILVGLWLVRGPKPAPAPEEDIRHFGEGDGE